MAKQRDVELVFEGPNGARVYVKASTISTARRAYLEGIARMVGLQPARGAGRRELVAQLATHRLHLKGVAA